MSIDWALLWHMGGYGAYVWTGWGVALLALGAEFFILWRRSRRLPTPGAAEAFRGGPPRQARPAVVPAPVPSAPGRPTEGRP